MLPAAVLAGGLGTRIRHRTGPSVPKALLVVGGSPFIDHKLRELRDGGVTRVVLLIGHGGDAIEAHVGDGSSLGLEVEYVHDPPELAGTGGAVRRALDRLGSAFLVTYGDTLLEVPLRRLERCLFSSRAQAVMTVLENEDRWETSNVDVTDGWVTKYEKSSAPGRHRFLDYGMLAMEASAFEQVSTPDPMDLATVIRDLVDRRRLLALRVSRRFYDIGNEESILTTEHFLARRPHR